MANEIERKFLVLGTPWKSLPQGEPMLQGYLHASPERVVRIRVEENNAWLTIKSATQGISRGEWEYAIPVNDANALLKLCEQPLIEKMRYRIPHEGETWELDVFMGENAGLVVAEIELDCEDQPFKLPEWVGQEVTQDARYLNSNLFRHPYSAW